MRVKWLGHASMLIKSEKGLRIITDPYIPGFFGVNYAPIDEEADIVTVSHEHDDHNNVSAVKGSPDVVRGHGVTNVKGVEFYGTGCYHDDSSGSQRGANTIFCFTLDDIRVCHLGDLGHDLSPKDQARIGTIDILLIPVGGNFTIDAEVAARTCLKLQPRVVIPMHYHNERCPDFPVAGVEDFLALIDNTRKENTSEVMFDKVSLPGSMEVVVLQPAL
ncbi:MBL fold metallo-hydrolase [Chloroflexota bacterium]